MKITIVCAGKLKEKYLHDGIIEYEKRLRSYADVSIIEINEERMKERPSAAEREETLRREGKRLRAKVPRDAYLIVLDIEGEAYTSEELSAKIDRIGLEGQSHIVFLICGSPSLDLHSRTSLFGFFSWSRFIAPLRLAAESHIIYRIQRGLCRICGDLFLYFWCILYSLP